jgi:magnesium transporter
MSAGFSAPSPAGAARRKIDMLTVHPASPKAKAGAARPAWLDLVDPTPDEQSIVESDFGFKLPSRDDLSEVESSSRIAEENGVLFMSVPIASHGRAFDEAPSPIGFVLSKDVLVTIRYSPSRSFDNAAARFGKCETGSSAEAFAILVEEMVDVTADRLESIAAGLDGVSRSVFRRPRARRDNHVRSNEALRNTLIDVGNSGERLSQMRSRILGLQRIIPFAAEPARHWIQDGIRSRLHVAQTDLASLSDYQLHLSDKVQFLLDAVLGFISTKQNDIFTVLTVVSVVGIPPTLVAGIYGMNFKNMPELDWSFGYQYGLAMIVLSTLVPLLWFKWRGWL